MVAMVAGSKLLQRGTNAMATQNDHNPPLRIELVIEILVRAVYEGLIQKMSLLLLFLEFQLSTNLLLPYIHE